MPRYRAVVLDGFTIALDLAGDAYKAIPQDPSASTDRLTEAAVTLEAPTAEVRIAASIDVPCGGRDLDDFPSVQDRATAFDWARLLISLPRALWALRFGRPDTWIADEAEQFPAATEGVLTAARRFRAMRPLVPYLSRCLPHALLLRSYLRTCGEDAMLVIGVRLFPFEAHSWVQAGDVVLTDDLEQTVGYTPIARG